MKRWSLRVPEDEAEPALVQMLDWFPAGVEEARDGGDVVLSGYADRPPADGLEAAEVEAGWADRWREFHRPVRVGGLWVGPPWCRPQGPAVVIDPGYAFGTGAHPSTRAALELLQRLDPGGPALDLGCGSGVLAIAAVRLGFGPVQGFDIDPLAVQAAGANADRNGVAARFAAADVLRDPLPAAPLWLANLQLDLLEQLLRRSDVPPAVVGSGLLASQTLHGAERVEVDGWAAELVTRG